VLAPRIARLEDILAPATEVEIPGEEDSITIASTVTVVHVDTENDSTMRSGRRTGASQGPPAALAMTR
jgi:transcription elongation GreA/GreB family factor